MKTLVLALTLAGIAAWATPSTLVSIPSTDIQAQGVWHLGVDCFMFAGGTDAAPPAFVDAGLTYGITPRVEAGIDLVSGQDNPLWLNAKYLLVSPAKSPVAVAAGVYNAATSTATNQQIAYVVGSTLVSKVRLTFGGYRGREQALAGDASGILLGIDHTNGKWWYGADYAGGKNAIGSWNVGIGYSLTDRIGLIVGYDNFNAPGARNSFNIQLDANL